ncbi:hypothetical protein OG782_02250 [Streptomyces sp. NBC_00876]|uniref:hypothetical protein n=1 Tax=Streptomyces sp. NBC_00876 TaxID=2975853 RepID=UPI0038697F3B|nr:hypothetical protein OG782_02250 [Streptomyces sp. NBC_00876]
MRSPTRTTGRAASALALCLALTLCAVPSPSYAAPRTAAVPSGPQSTTAYGGSRYASQECESGPAGCPGGHKWLYRYSYFLGIHPFTGPDAVRRQLTDHFWLFPVSGRCPARVRPADECDLLGGNPVRVEAVSGDHLQIATLPGHDLGDGLHIRFTFTRTFGFHYMVVGAWQDRPTRCTQAVLCGTASRAGAWVLWRLLAGTLTLSAYVA